MFGNREELLKEEAQKVATETSNRIAEKLRDSFPVWARDAIDKELRKHSAVIRLAPVFDQMDEETRKKALLFSFFVSNGANPDSAMSLVMLAGKQDTVKEKIKVTPYNAVPEKEVEKHE
jgi:hypothetical protein